MPAAPAAALLSRRHRLGLAALYLGSLALRLVFLAGLDARETLRADGWHYAALAWNLGNRGVYSTSLAEPLVPHMRWPPGYPLLLAPFYRGRDMQAGTEAALPVQVVLGSAVPVLGVLVATHLLPYPLAWLAGLCAACCPLLVTTPAFLVTETPFTLLLLCWLLLLFRLAERPSVGVAVASGLLAGGLTMVRSSGLVLALVAGGWLAARGAGAARRRAALVLVVLALTPVLAWGVRSRIAAARGTPAPSYFARPLAEGIYPDLVYADSARGYAMLADPEFPRFSESIGRTAAEMLERTRADPWPNLRWHLVDRWLVLWEFGMIQSPPLHVYPVARGLFRPAALDPGISRDEPLAPLYWIFRALWYWCVVPAVLLGAAIVLRRRRADPGPASRARELCYVLLAGHVLLHGVVIPEPRFLVPVRPILFALALATLADCARRLTTRVTPAVIAAVALVAVAGWTSGIVETRRAPAARRAAAALVERGRRLEAAGDLAGALASYEEARAADPRNFDAAMLAGLIHHRLGDPGTAVARYRDVLAVRDTHYGAHYQLATALLAQGRTAEARAAWAGFTRLAEAIGDHASIEQAPAALRAIR